MNIFHKIVIKTVTIKQQRQVLPCQAFIRLAGGTKIEKIACGR